MVLHHFLKIQHPTLVEGDCLILNPLSATPAALLAHEDHPPQEGYAVKHSSSPLQHTSDTAFSSMFLSLQLPSFGHKGD